MICFVLFCCVGMNRIAAELQFCSNKKCYAELPCVKLMCYLRPGNRAIVRTSWNSIGSYFEFFESCWQAHFNLGLLPPEVYP